MFTDDHKVRVLHTQVGKHAKDAVVPARDYGHDVFRLADIGAVAWEGEAPPRPSAEEIERLEKGQPPAAPPTMAATVGVADPSLCAEVDDLRNGLTALTQDLEAQGTAIAALTEQVAALQEQATAPSQGKSRKHQAE